MNQPAKELPHIADRFKRSIVAETAMRLAAKHGRLKMYSSGQVAEAMSAANFPAAWTGWVVAVFCTGPEFNDYCAAQGLNADYSNTRLDMLQFVDKPQAKSPGDALAATAMAGVAGLAAGSVLAGTNDQKNDSGDGVVDAADLAVDVVGTVFDVLDIFS